MSSIGATPVVVGVPLQASPSEPVLTFAAREANRRGTGVKLVHGEEPSYGLSVSEPLPSLRDREAEGRRCLDEAAAFLRPLLDADDEIECVVSRATGVAALLEESRHAALVVVQRQDLSRLERVSAGSTSSTLSARADCPVAVVTEHGNGTAPHVGVVVGVDGGGHAEHALEVAFEEASLRAVPLTAVHVWSSEELMLTYGLVPMLPEEMETQRKLALLGLSEALAGFTERFPDVVLQPRLVDASVVDGLVAVSREAELLVVARHGKTRMGSLALGSVARKCLDRALCPVVVTPTSRHRKH